MDAASRLGGKQRSNCGLTCLRACCIFSFRQSGQSAERSHQEEVASLSLAAQERQRELTELLQQTEEEQQQRGQCQGAFTPRVRAEGSIGLCWFLLASVGWTGLRQPAFSLCSPFFTLSFFTSSFLHGTFSSYSSTLQMKQRYNVKKNLTIVCYFS